MGYDAIKIWSEFPQISLRVVLMNWEAAKLFSCSEANFIIYNSIFVITLPLTAFCVCVTYCLHVHILPPTSCLHCKHISIKVNSIQCCKSNMDPYFLNVQEMYVVVHYIIVSRCSMAGSCIRHRQQCQRQHKHTKIVSYIHT